MPGYKNHYKNNKFKSTTKSNEKQSKQIATNTKAIKQLKSAPERKVMLNGRSFLASDTGLDHNVLNGILQGVEDNERIGDQITMKSLQLNLINALNIDGSTMWRHLIIIDNQNNQGTTEAPLNHIFNRAATFSDATFSTYNDDYVGRDKRYQVLWDSKAQYIAFQSGNNARTYKLHIRLGHKVRFEGNTGTGEDIIDRCIFLYSIHIGAASTWGFSSNIFFTDT